MTVTLGYLFTFSTPESSKSESCYDLWSVGQSILKAPVRFPIYSLKAEPTENTASNNSSIVACGLLLDHVVVINRCIATNALLIVPLHVYHIVSYQWTFILTPEFWLWALMSHNLVIWKVIPNFLSWVYRISYPWYLWSYPLL
jgi:hypothetical protein